MQSQERLYAYVYAWVRNTADTQDVVQQTSTVLWQKFADFDPETDFFRWALVVAKYTTLNFLRCRRTHRARFSEKFMECLAEEELLVETELEEARSESLKTCVKKLRESDQKLLRSRYGSGMRVGQIADLLGRSSSSISTSLRRIHTALLECIEKNIERENLI